MSNPLARRLQEMQQMQQNDFSQFPMQQMQQNNQNPVEDQMIASAKKINDMFNAAQDKNKAFNELVKNNPTIAMINQMCNGRNPKDVFFEECKRRGVDANALIDKLGFLK